MQKLWKKYKNMNIAAKAALWFVFCNLLTKGISTITVPIFTRLLTTEEYGTYSLYLSWLNIFTIITSLNLYYGAYNNALNKYQDDATRSRYIASMQGIVTTLVLVLSTIYLLNKDFWNQILGLSTPIMCMMLVELMVAPAMLFWSGRLRFEFRYKAMVLVTLIKSILNPVLGLLLVLYWDQGHDVARIMGVVISEVLVSGSILVYQFVKGKCFYDGKFWKYALAFNIPLIPHYLSGTILNQGDRIMIENMVGRSEVAIYSIAYNIGTLIMLFTNAINNSLTPWFYDKLNKKDYASIRKNTLSILFGIAILILGLMIVAPEAVWFFGSAKYAQAVYVIPPVASSVFFIFLFNIFAIPQMYYEDKRFLPVSSICAAILNIILNFVFIKIFGYIAAGYTTLVCYVMYSIGHYYFTVKVCQRNIPGAVLFDIKGIILLSIALIVLTFLFSFLYIYSMIRYIVLCIAIIVLFVERKQVISLLKTMMRRK